MKIKKKTVKKKGRPLKKIDWETVDKLCHIHCTGPEIADFLGICNDTLTDAARREKGMLFSEYIKMKSAGGKASLRRMQWKAAESGSVGMLVWLGKQYLDQSDKNELSGKKGSDIKLSIENVLNNMKHETK